jgi:hypothetical protein
MIRPTGLLATLLSLVAAHRPAFRQERPYQRCLALVLGQVCALGRHTLTQVLLALGLSQADWSGFYRLLSRPRLDYDHLVRRFLLETLFAVAAGTPYLVALDGVQIPRSSQRMLGTSWLKAPRTPPWKPGIHRAQRFVHLAWLPPVNARGYSRAIPLRLDPALPAKAVRPPEQPAQKEWEVGLAQLRWLRRCLDDAGRASQRVLAVADSVYGPAAMWTALPERVTLLTRCARNRALFALPPAAAGPGRPRKYGVRAPTPTEWLHVRPGWQHTTLQVRGRTIRLTYRMEGPYLVKPAPTQPLYLLVVKGVSRKNGALRDPTFWLVSAVPDAAGTWTAPYPAAVLLAAAWQRWEVEVTHREAKTGFGVGEAQCWSRVSALLAVQWQWWTYAVVLLAAYRVWGLDPPPARRVSRWWLGSRRWTLGQVQEALRQELWALGEFTPVWAWTAPNWTEMEAGLTRQTNAVLAARRG